MRTHVFHHLLERRHARDRVFGKLPGEGDGPHQLAVNVDRTAAHSLNDARVLQVAAGQSAEDHVAAGIDPAHHAQHFRAELFELCPDHHRLSGSLHPWTDVVDLPVRLRVRFPAPAVADQARPLKRNKAKPIWDRVRFNKRIDEHSLSRTGAGPKTRKGVNPVGMID